MRKILYIFTVFIAMTTGAWAITRDAELTNTTPYNYNYMYPYMNNKMRTNLNPGTTPSQSLSPINAVVKTTKIGPQRRVVSRTPARSATTNMASPSAASGRGVRARSATNTNTPMRRNAQPTTPPRRVIARSGSVYPDTGHRNTSPSYRGAATTSTTYTVANIPASRCLADYSECMNGFCERPDTQYNRCYCSAKLSQIDSQYQSTIDSLIRQILTLRGTNKWSDAEMNEYWMGVMGNYTTENSWTNLDNALNIDWAGMESRVRGQNAFVTGHEYCIQHLRGCAYAASNIRDAYRSEIARDCNTYEQSLQRVQNAAESILEAYK